jgi:hypothetical protein
MGDFAACVMAFYDSTLPPYNKAAQDANRLNMKKR